MEGFTNPEQLILNSLRSFPLMQRVVPLPEKIIYLSPADLGGSWVYDRYRRSRGDS